MAQTTSIKATLLESDQAQPEVTVNAALNLFDAAAGQLLSHAVATDGDYTLATGTDPPEWVFGTVEVTDTGGTLTGAANVFCPAHEKAYRFVNRTAQALTLRTATGSGGIAVAAARAAVLQCDGAVVFRITADSPTT